MVLSAIAARLRDRNNFVDWPSWVRVRLHGLLRRMPYARMIRRCSPWLVHPRGFSSPLLLRPMTTDWLVLQQYLIGEMDPALVLPLKSARTIVDLGANFGLTLALWLERAPIARIIAVEPDRENLLMCRRNIGLRDAETRVNLYEAFIGGCRRMAMINREGGAWGYRMKEGGGAADVDGVRVLTMDDILPPDRDPVDLLKCDIEGAEAELFSNSRNWIGRVKYVFVEIHQPYSVGALISDLSRNGWVFKIRHQHTHASGTVLLLERE
jgi:FkbM family methyltransferase